MTDDSTYLPIDLQRGLKTLPPEREDPFPHPADLSPDALLSRRVEVIEQAGNAIDAELRFGVRAPSR